LLKDEFVVFSPETFIKIENNELSSFPMKGTIDASLVDAEKSLLSNKKEIAEHVTIVDLIRNDMSINADNVSVEAFRYVDEIKTDNKSLLQVSSKITGKVKPRTQLGDLVFSLLPAGSISGAPKKKTLEILDRVENYNRGYYTGVFGIFDGEKLDSGVMIRFIENQKGKLVYKSGGGIHHLSDVHSEYQELIDKIYVPIS
jgi:para-aminobenzoate synthetase component 1